MEILTHAKKLCLMPLFLFSLCISNEDCGIPSVG